MSPAEEMKGLAARAREAARAMRRAPAAAKTRALEYLATLLQAREDAILDAIQKDLEAARIAGVDAPRLDRLTLTPAIMEEMRAACRHGGHFARSRGATESQWAAAQRPAGGSDAHPPGRCGHDLRGPAQCDH